jgi:serine/threonine protein kinase
VQVELYAQVVSTTNVVVVPRIVSKLLNVSDSSLGAHGCTSLMVDGMVPDTTYAVAVRAYTVAGPGPYSAATEATTSSLTAFQTEGLSAAALSAEILRMLGWKSGFGIEWLASESLDPRHLLHYELRDDGLPPSMDIVYRGNSSFVPIQSVVGLLSVRTVTIGGFGPFSDPIDVSLIRAKTSSVDTSAVAGSIGGAIFFVVLFLLLVVFAPRYIRARRRIQELATVRRMLPPSMLATLDEINGGRIVLPRPIVAQDLTVLDVLGEGKFGSVVKAILDETARGGIPGYLVAVKMAKEGATASQIDEMRLEAAMMAQLNHPNVVGLIGQVSQKDLFLIVVQFCENGSLLQWLQDESEKAQRSVLIGMCNEVASGMAYLTCIGMVHRDLAARNVLLSSDFTCKISDFGLSSSQHKETGLISTPASKMATRWAAPEYIIDNQFTTKSDVWSFGVLMYEVFSEGEKPYIGWSNKRVIDEVKTGYRLPQPTQCPDAVYALMQQCWYAGPDLRPDFTKLEGSLHEACAAAIDEERSNACPTVEDVQESNVLTRLNESINAVIAQSGRTSELNISAFESDPVGRQSSRSAMIARSSPSKVMRPMISSRTSMSKTSLPPRTSKAKFKSPKPSLHRVTLAQMGKPSSYTDLLGKDGKPIRASQEISQVPPTYQKRLMADDTLLPARPYAGAVPTPRGTFLVGLIFFSVPLTHSRH